MSLKRRLIDRIDRKLRDYPNATSLERWMGSVFLRFFPRQLTCAEFERFVLEYHEGLLSPAQRKRFEFHMRICPMCDVHFQTYVKAVQMGRALCDWDERDDPAPLPDDLVGAILDARRAED